MEKILKQYEDLKALAEEKAKAIKPDGKLRFAFRLNSNLLNVRNASAKSALREILLDCTGDTVPELEEGDTCVVLFYVWICGRPRMDFDWDIYKEAYDRSDNVILIRLCPLSSRNKIQIQGISGWRGYVKKGSVTCREDLSVKLDSFFEFNWLYHYIPSIEHLKPPKGYEINPIDNELHNSCVRGLKARIAQMEGGVQPILPPVCTPGISGWQRLLAGHFHF